ncbi:thiamine biosynthesis lipoprotein [Jatrophihabitans endophyticus]|uniref:FAD:protein FMN transferase n=1 Tax=Jatrophihabitans endophyticus TaxID=1206085 RepID=A0A1M5R184_9ACTN|nr:FAD:protein FMN transferase [Jatrophihabitans endophyticus]SHH19729.1 thiamine biosynthesis lipoprotein [Jatrophihabitans endophyticus]
MTATFETTAWSCAVRLVVTDDRVLDRAARDLVALLDRVDRAASRFRADSALGVANARAGRPCAIPRLLVDLVGAALDAAAATDGAVDPTLGLAMQRIGYDRDIAAVQAGDVAAGSPTVPSLPGRWRSVRLHREAGLLTVPVGTALDLGATAKAWTADRAATTLAGRYGTGVLVELGGDLAVAGSRPGGWVVRVAERAGAGDGQLITLRHGGLTTSTTTVRTWTRGGRPQHHIVDPVSGEPVTGPWRTATVAAGSALAANTASTAAVVMGAGARAWLRDQGLAARLVDQAGAVHVLGGWPDPRPAAELLGAAS